jgi:hypothetical protein
MVGEEGLTKRLPGGAMEKMRHETRFEISKLFQGFASLGLLAGIVAVFGPTGCSNSLQEAIATNFSVMLRSKSSRRAWMNSAIN